MIKVRTGKTEKFACLQVLTGHGNDSRDEGLRFSKKPGGHSSHLVFRGLAEDPRKDQQQSSGGKLHRRLVSAEGLKRSNNGGVSLPIELFISSTKERRAGVSNGSS